MKSPMTLSNHRSRSPFLNWRFLRRDLLPLALAALAVLVLYSIFSGAEPAAAQSSDTLVSNTGQGMPNTITTDVTADPHAQAFVTGSNAGGCRIDSIGLYINSASDRRTPVVAIHAASGDDPASEALHTLVNPTLSASSSGVQTFTAQGLTLAASTRYFLVISCAAGGGSGKCVNLPATESAAEDSGAASGWSIDDSFLLRADGTWGTTILNDPFMISVQGKALGTVTATAALGGPNSLEIGWTAYTGTSNYEVQWKSGEEAFSSTRSSGTELTGTEYTIPNLVAGTAYKVRVRAYDSMEALIAQSGELTPPSVIGAIGGLTLTPDGRYAIVASWNAFDGTDEYKVKWQAAGGEEQSATVSHPTTAVASHRLTGLTKNTEYTVTVEAENDSDTVIANATGKATTHNDVTGITLTPGSHQVDVSWTATLGASGYLVDTRIPGATSAISRDDVSGTSHTVTGLEPDTEYKITIAAEDAGGNTFTDGSATTTTLAIPTTKPGIEMRGTFRMITHAAIAQEPLGSAFTVTLTEPAPLSDQKMTISLGGTDGGSFVITCTPITVYQADPCTEGYEVKANEKITVKVQLRAKEGVTYHPSVKRTHSVTITASSGASTDASIGKKSVTFPVHTITRGSGPMRPTPANQPPAFPAGRGTWGGDVLVTDSETTVYMCEEAIFRFPQARDPEGLWVDYLVEVYDEDGKLINLNLEEFRKDTIIYAPRSGWDNTIYTSEPELTEEEAEGKTEEEKAALKARLTLKTLADSPDSQWSTQRSVHFRPIEHLVGGLYSVKVTPRDETQPGVPVSYGRALHSKALRIEYSAVRKSPEAYDRPEVEHCNAGGYAYVRGHEEHDWDIAPTTYLMELDDNNVLVPQRDANNSKIIDPSAQARGTIPDPDPETRIRNGDTTTKTENNTDFGEVEAREVSEKLDDDGNVEMDADGNVIFEVTEPGYVVKRYWVTNRGGKNLTVSGVTLTDNPTGAFTIEKAPKTTAIALSDFTPFEIRFTPNNGFGYEHSATVNIANTDADRPGFTFRISGTGKGENFPNEQVSQVPTHNGQISVTAPEQTVDHGATLTHTVPEPTTDDDAPLSYEARTSDGNPLPSWITFDSTSRVVTAAPQEAQAGESLTITVRAWRTLLGDTGKNQYAWTYTLLIRVNEIPLLPSDCAADATALTNTASVSGTWTADQQCHRYSFDTDRRGPFDLRLSSTTAPVDLYLHGGTDTSGTPVAKSVKYDAASNSTRAAAAARIRLPQWSGTDYADTLPPGQYTVVARYADLTGLLLPGYTHPEPPIGYTMSLDAQPKGMPIGIYQNLNGCTAPALTAGTASARTFNGTNCTSIGAIGRPALYWSINVPDPGVGRAALLTVNACTGADTYIRPGTMAQLRSSRPGPIAKGYNIKGGCTVVQAYLVHQDGHDWSGAYTIETTTLRYGRTSHSMSVTWSSRDECVNCAPTIPDVEEQAIFGTGETGAITATASCATSKELPEAIGGNGGQYEYRVWKRGQRAEFSENGLSFNPSTRILSGTPVSTGTHQLTYEVHDGDDNRNTSDAYRKDLDITVAAKQGSNCPSQQAFAPPNTGPSFSGTIGTLTATVGQAFSQKLPFAEDDENDALYYSVAPSGGGTLPGWLRFDTSTLVLSGTPGSGDAPATHELAYQVRDDGQPIMRVAILFTLNVAAAQTQTGPEVPEPPANQAPTFSEGASATRSVAENSADGTNVGAAVTAADPDPGDTLTYSLSGTDAASFIIEAATGQITTKTGVTYDYESKSSYSLTVDVSDGNGGTASIAVTVNLNDVLECYNEAGTLSETASIDGNWNAADCKAHHQDSRARYLHFTLDAETEVTITLSAGTLYVSSDTPSNGWGTTPGGGYEHRVNTRKGNGKLLHDGSASTATLTLPAGDYTAEAAQTTDGGETFTLEVGLPEPATSENKSEPEPANQAPTFSEGASATRQVAENSAAGTSVGSAVTATDNDNDTLAYILSGTDAASFEIGSSTGQITTKTGVTYDYEIKSIYSLTVGVSDGKGGTDTIAVTVNITDVNETPVFSEGDTATREVAENSSGGVNVGAAITATDPDSGNTLTYSLSGTDAASFEIGSSTGQITTKSGETYDYETKKSYSVTVGVSDGNGGTDSIAVTVNLTDVDETPQPPPNKAPSFTEGASATRQVAENSAAGTSVGSAVTATDADNDTLTYTLSGTDASSFTIGSSTGQITTKAGVTYDYETKQSYSVTVSVSDGNGGTDSIAVTVSLTDVEETPPVVEKPDPPAPTPPTADAGADFNGKRGEVLTLSGSGTANAAGSQTLTYGWRISGASHTELASASAFLSDADSAEATFTMPRRKNMTDRSALDDGNWIEFELTVTDGDGESSSDTVKVTISGTTWTPD